MELHTPLTVAGNFLRKYHSQIYSVLLYLGTTLLTYIDIAKYHMESLQY